MSAHHRYKKRPRYETETDSSSDISNSCLAIWKAIEDNFSNLINPEIYDSDEQDTYACFHGSTDRRDAGDSAIEYCILLAEDFISWIKKFNERREYAFTSRIQKYTTSPTLLTFQQQESKKSALFQLVNNVLKNTIRDNPANLETAHSDSSSQLGHAPKTDIMQSALATTLTSLMSQLQTKWEEIERQIQPIDPIEHQNFLFRDLPITSVWMTTLNKLTDVQRRSASNYYQTKLKQIELHSRTFTMMTQLLERIQSAQPLEEAVQTTVTQYLQEVGELENSCHVLWLRLLELTLCIDENFLQNLNLTTYLPRMSSQNKDQYFLTKGLAGNRSPAVPYSDDPGQKIHCNILINPLEDSRPLMDLRADSDLFFLPTLRNFLSPNVAHRNGPESGFESELSPQSNIAGKCRQTVRGCAEVQWRHSKSSLYGSTWPSTLGAGRPSSCIGLYSETLADGNAHGLNRQALGERSKNCHTQVELKSAKYPCAIMSDTEAKSYGVSLQNEVRFFSLTNPFINGGDVEHLGLQKANELEKVYQHNGFQKVNNGSVIRRRRVKRKQDVSGKKHRNISRFPQFDASTRCPATARSTPVTNNCFKDLSSGSDSSLSTSSTNSDMPPSLRSSENQREPESEMCTHSTNDWEICEPAASSFEETRSAVECQRNAGESSHHAVNRKPFKVPSNRKSRRKRARLIHSSPTLPHDLLTNSECASQRNAIRTMQEKLKHARITPSYTIPNVKRYTDPEATTSSNSSLAGDASELEQMGWRRQIRSFLDAASRAEAMIRSQRGSDSLKQWLDSLNPHLIRPDEPSENPQGDTERQRLQSGTSTKSSILSKHSTDPDLSNISPSKVLDVHEPLMNYWDNYQVPLYSSSSETGAREPPTTYAEEFPWDDVGNPLTDPSQDELVTEEPNVPDNVPTSYRPFCSPITSDTHPRLHGASSSTVGREDTMDLSTTTSVLFNQKSSSMEASFEVCSPSIVTIDSQANADQYCPTGSLRRTPSPSLIYGLRTHPDGGSQHRIDREPASQTPVGTDTNQTRTPVRFLSLEPEYPSSNSTRHFHTLPRVVPKPRIRYNSTNMQEGGLNSAPIRCSSALSLEELKHLRNKWLCSDIIVWSKQQLTDLMCSLRRTLTTPVLATTACKHDVGTSVRDGAQTWLQWQNDVSEIIRSAEWNLKVLVDHTSYHNNEQGSDSSSNQDILFPKLFNPEAASLQEQWKEIIENARYWLLHSCSSETLRQQLQVLHEKILDIAGSVRQLSNRMPRQDVNNPKNESEDPWTSEHASIQNMIQRYLSELRRLSGQMQRLYGKFERRFFRQQHMSLAEDAVRTFAITNSELRGQLECLNSQLLATQERLTRVTRVDVSRRTSSNLSTSRSSQYRSDVSEGASPKRICTCCVGCEDVAYLGPYSSRPPPKTTWYGKHITKCGRRYIIVLVAGGLVFLSCLCCYIMMKVASCDSSPETWRAVFIILGEWFPFLFDTSPFPCPLRRERLSGILDYTYGSSPI
ncbi:hypothetical protein T265_00072 [Opisthorchis viverrini]|uniref:Uncharacterized protein n=1 Tax=Opisthorchis viverrini TaxID=6198 RepID=A0A075A4D4_OPIVI|nr:hypothetical protein T265_00072 [Opisthorchis viverrini]KER34211.1 hypothetical protein T265_00072 [Opisthorchis viverrini]